MSFTAAETVLASSSHGGKYYMDITPEKSRTRAQEPVESTRVPVLQPISPASQPQTAPSPSSSSKPEMATRVPLCLGAVASSTTVACQYSIHRDYLPAAIQATMSKRTPRTKSLLDRDGWVTARTRVDKAAVAVVMDRLVRAGAEDIIILEPYSMGMI